MSKADIEHLRERARFIRTETVRLITIAKSGHYTSIFSAAEILSVLYYHVMQLQADPLWKDRDRLIMSKGHVAVGVYPVLADKGFFPKEWLDNYARLGSPLGDHPDMRKVPGVDFSSGSLGHGLSIGVGMALGLKRKQSPGRVFVLLGDGELNEGQNWEAAQAGARRCPGAGSCCPRRVAPADSPPPSGVEEHPNSRTCEHPDSRTRLTVPLDWAPSLSDPRRGASDGEDREATRGDCTGDG